MIVKDVPIEIRWGNLKQSHCRLYIETQGRQLQETASYNHNSFKRPFSLIAWLLGLDATAD